MSDDNNTEQKDRDEVDDQDSIDSEELIDILQNRRRRLCVYFLQQHEEIYITQLARLIASVESGKDIDDVEGTEVKSVYTALHQSHLPKLDDFGIIEYNKITGNIKIDSSRNDLPTIEIQTLSDGNSAIARVVLFASTFVTSILAFTTAGLIGQIATYALPVFIIILTSTLLFSGKSAKNIDPPSSLDVPTEINKETTSR